MLKLAQRVSVYLKLSVLSSLYTSRWKSAIYICVNSITKIRLRPAFLWEQAKTAMCFVKAASLSFLAFLKKSQIECVWAFRVCVLCFEPWWSTYVDPWVARAVNENTRYVLFKGIFFGSLGDIDGIFSGKACVTVFATGGGFTQAFVEFVNG